MNVKYFVIILLAFARLLPVGAQYDSDAKERESMAKAKVKTQTQWTHDYVDGKPSNKGYRASVTRYNALGNITEIVNYNEEGKIISVVVYQYDNRENRVNYERYEGNREKLKYSQRIVYDSKGNKTREYGFDGATAYSNTFQYDASGKISEITYTVDNALVEKRKLTYSGNKTDIQVFDAGNKLTYRQENSYNDKGLLLSEIKTGGQGNVVHTLDMQYNTTDDLTEETKKRADNRIDYQKFYQYDSENRLIKIETASADGSKFVSHEYKYNSSGNVSVETWKKTERAKEYSSKKFTYDAKGLYTEVDCFFATYPLNSLYKYSYEFF